MRIDHELNPFGIIKRFKIPYGDEVHINGVIKAHTEEGFDEVGYFSGEVRYQNGREIGGIKEDKFYQDLKRGVLTQEEVEGKLKRWCESMGLEILSSEEVIEGVFN